MTRLRADDTLTVRLMTAHTSVGQGAVTVGDVPGILLLGRHRQTVRVLTHLALFIKERGRQQAANGGRGCGDITGHPVTVRQRLGVTLDFRKFSSRTAPRNRPRSAAWVPMILRISIRADWGRGVNGVKCWGGASASANCCSMGGGFGAASLPRQPANNQARDHNHEIDEAANFPNIPGMM